MASKPTKLKSAWPEGKAPGSVEEYCQCLDASRVMSAEDCRAFMASLAEANQPQTAKALALELLKAGKLTRYQAQGVLQGKVRFLTFGEYFILEKLGEGGMGQVFKAEHRRMRRLVALKVLTGAAMKDADARKRFEREVHAAARLIHPNIVTAFDANEHEGVHFLVMEYVEGHDLSVIVGKQGPLPPATAIDYVLQAARALSFAHSKGVVHRDIKPGNLLVDREGTVKILDMGLARIELGSGGQELTNTGQVMGTVDYMAPEQAEDTHSADGRADIYSLGCTLYRLLSGDVLYGGDSVVKKILAHRGADIPPLREVCPAAPAALEATFRKMVAKKASDRQQTMADVVAELEGVAREMVRTPGAPSQGGERTVDLKFSEFLTGLSEKTSKSATVTAQKSMTKVSAANEVTQDLTSESTTAGLGAAPTQTLIQAAVPATNTSRPSATKASRADAVKLAKKLWVAAGAAVLGLVLAAAGVVMFLPAGDGTVRIEINDPSIEVTVSESGYKVKGKTEEVHIKPGEHTLHVKTGELEFDTKKFVIGKGENPAVKVELLVDKVQVIGEGGKLLGEKASKRPSSVANTNSVPTTPKNFALEFDGVSNQRVRIPTLVDDGKGPLTIEAWIRPSELTDNIGAIFGPSNSATGASLRRMPRIFAFSSPALDGSPSWHVSGGRLSLDYMHIAGVRDRTTLRLYVDGKLVSGEVNVKAKNPNETPSTDSRIGYTGGGTHFAGLIDEVRVSNIARYATDFVPAVRFTPDANTLALYHFDEGQGDELKDSSGKGHHGKIEGAKWVSVSKEATTANPQSTPGNWNNLFNGRDLDGWVQKGHPGWSVKDGVITGTTSGPVGWLMANREYGDFELELEYRLPPGGNSGVFVRAPAEGNVTGGQFNEIQLLDDPSPKFKSVDLKGRTGALYSQVAPSRAPFGAANTWRQLKVGAMGNQAKVTLDGIEVLNARLRAGTASRGHIGLQLYSPGVEFRKIRIREGSLDSTGTAVSGARSPAASASTPASGEFELDLSPIVDGALARVEIDHARPEPPLTIEMFATPRTYSGQSKIPAASDSERKNRSLFSTGRNVVFWLYQLDSVWQVGARYESNRSASAWLKPIQLNRCVHLATVITPEELKFFVDGKLAMAKAVDSAFAKEVGPLIIGWYGGDGRHANGIFEPFDGTVDEVRISTVARYTSDFVPTLRLSSDKDTWGLYHCDEGQGDTLKDSSGNGHHGKVLGAKWVGNSSALSPRAATSSQSNGSADGKKVTPSGFDLLRLVDLKRDAGMGNWKQVADGIACDNPAGASVLQLPYEPPDEYDLEVEFTPTAPGLNVNHYLAGQGASFAWKLNAHRQVPPLYGLELLDGKLMPQRKEGTTEFDVALQVGQRYRSTVEVRKASIKGLLDGREIMQWTGDFKRLSMETATPMPFPGRLGIGSWRRAVTFHKVTVREISLPGKLVDAIQQDTAARPTNEAARASTSPFDLLKGQRRSAPIDLPKTARVTEARQRLIDLYIAWGKPDEATNWRKILDERKTAETPAAEPAEKP